MLVGIFVAALLPRGVEMALQGPWQRSVGTQEEELVGMAWGWCLSALTGVLLDRA